MTDAAIPLTQSAVEQFAEDYLQAIGCTIEKKEEEWEVGVPQETDSEVLTEDVTLVCAHEDNESNGSVKHLHPESQFFQELLTEASKRTPAGKITLPSERTGVDPPAWLRGSDVAVEEMEFTPYYDRSAVVILFRVAIETVSEYQREFLRAIALDIRSQEPVRRLEETFLNVTSVGGNTTADTRPSVERSKAESLLDEARSRVVDRVQNLVDEIHDEASRAADAEVEEFRQMQLQLIQELEERRSNLSEKIDELGELINADQQSKRVEALKERKALKAEYEDVDEELEYLQQRRDQGFPERQREIRDRHSLEVRISPLALTEIEYESGEVEIQLNEENTTRTVTVGYGSGAGVTEAVQCSSCGQELTEKNPLWTIKGGLRCNKCHHEDS